MRRSRGRQYGTILTPSGGGSHAQSGLCGVRNAELMGTANGKLIETAVAGCGTEGEVAIDIICIGTCNVWF